MNKYLSEKYYSLLLMDTFLNSEAAEIDAALPLIAPERLNLSNKINEIRPTVVLAEQYNKGFAEAKRNLREKLVIEAYKVGNAASLYYTLVVPDKTLSQRARFTQTDMVRLPTDELLSKARLIHQTAQPVKNLLAPYGVDAATVDGLPAHIEAFFNQKEAPAEARSRAKEARKTLRQLFKDADVLLLRLDNLFRLLYFSHRRLFDQYKASRKIKQLPTNRTIKQGLLKANTATAATYARGYLNASSRITFINQSAHTKGETLAFYFAAQRGAQPTPGQAIIALPAATEKTLVIGQHGFTEATPVLMVLNASSKNIRWKTKVLLKED